MNFEPSRTGHGTDHCKNEQKPYMGVSCIIHQLFKQPGLQPCAAFRSFIAYTLVTHVGSEDELVDVPGKHRAGWEDAGVSRRHDGSWDGAEAEKGDEVGRQVLQDHRQDHTRLLLSQRVRPLVSRFVPSYNKKQKAKLYVACNIELTRAIMIASCRSHSPVSIICSLHACATIRNENLQSRWIFSLISFHF